MFKEKHPVLAVRPSGDTSRLPMTLDISTSLTSSLPRLAAGLIFVVAGLMVTGQFGPSAGFGPLMGLIFELAPWLIVAVGTWALVRGILGIVEKRKLVIGDGEVSVTGTNMFRRESWSEPLSAYQGIRWREIVIYRGSTTGSSSGTTSDRAKYFQVLEIVHPDRGKTVPLLVTRRHDGVRGDWERLAKLIGVPAIDARGGSATMREPEDVDKSIKELASEGKIDAEWKECPVPRGLEIAYLGEVDDPDNQSIQVTFWTPRYPVWLYGAVSLFGGFFVVLGISDAALLPIILGGGLIYGVIWHYRSEMANPRTLTITRSALQIETPSPGNPGNSENVPHRAIESVEITVRQDRQIIGERLAIATDRQEYEVGSGLSREALNWLRRLILSAVTKA